MTEYVDGHCILYREGQLKALALESIQDNCTRKFFLSPESHLSLAETILDKDYNVTGIHLEMKPGFEKQINRYHAFIRIEDGSDSFFDNLIMVPIYSSCIKDGVQHHEDSKGCVSWITDVYRYNVKDVDAISWGQ